MRLVVGTLPNPSVERLRTLEEMVKAMEVNSPPGLDTIDMPSTRDGHTSKVKGAQFRQI